jgi:hypothetical protein
MALAREQHAGGGSGGDTAGSSSGGGLTLFYVPVQRDEQGRPQATGCRPRHLLVAHLTPAVVPGPRRCFPQPSVPQSAPLPSLRLPACRRVLRWCG